MLFCSKHTFALQALRRLVGYLLFVVPVYPLPAQNLILNPGFEDWNSEVIYRLDTSESMFPGVRGWFTDDPRTEAQVNVCNDTLSKFFLRNWRYIPRSGGSFGSIASGSSTFDTIPRKNFYQTRLSQPLEAGCRYQLTFYVLPVHTNYGLPLNMTREMYHVSNRLGAYFSQFRPQDTTTFPLMDKYNGAIVPQVAIDTATFIADTTAYTRVRGAFTAQGGERYMTVGNFHSLAQTRFQNLFTGAAWTNITDSTILLSGFYIDDFELIKVSTPGTSVSLQAEKTSICPGEQVFLRANAVGADSIYWSTGETGPGIYIEEPGTYTVTAVCDCGFTYTDSITITAQSELPLIKLEDGEICGEESAILDLPTGAEYRLNGVPVVPPVEIKVPGAYTLQAQNECGLAEYSFVMEEVDCSLRYFLPDAFTPNGDRVNDYFEIMPNRDIPGFRLVIINRWGQTVFETTDAFFRWDGTYRDAPCPQDVYTYIIFGSPEVIPEGKVQSTLLLMR